ncbi:hypothetical protein LguiA_033883 [Lonicera macranthoides]
MGMSMVDCKIGTIVWVRRKNGSWWPGRIVEPPPPSNQFRTPRIGTPIKLLGRGRETDNLDWFNIEKSKRVKAFRCGEFDECIQRAESQQGYTSGDTLKYERREDAILYALELEKQELRKKLKRPGTSREEQVGSVYRAKRSRCIYLQTESNKFSERKFSHPQPLKVSPSSVGTDNSSSIQSGSADKNTPPGSMGSKSSNGDYWNEKRDEAIKGSNNEHNELGYLSEEHAWKLKRKLKIRNLNKISGVKSDEQSYLQSQNGTQHREDTLNSTATFEQFGSANISYEDMKDIMLIDADIKVEALYRGEHVPLVCLMSRLNGKAIVGHPVDIEVIEDGSSETGPRKNDDFAPDLFDYGKSIFVQPVWRTSRRTPVRYAPKPEDNSTVNNCKLLKKPSLANQKVKKTLGDAERKHGGTVSDVKATRVTCIPVNHIFSTLLIAVGGVQK